MCWPSFGGLKFFSSSLKPNLFPFNWHLNMLFACYYTQNHKSQNQLLPEPHQEKNRVFTFSSIWIIHCKCLVLPNKTSPLLIQKPQEGKSALLRHPVSYNIEKYFLQNFIILFFFEGGACRVALFCFIWESVRKRKRIREMWELSNRSSLTKTSPLKAATSRGGRNTVAENTE